MSLKPVGPRLLVKPLETQEVTPGGVVLPDQSRRPVEGKGVILAFGSGKTTGVVGEDPGQPGSGTVVSVGDVIVYKPHGGYDVLVESKAEDGTTEQEVFLILHCDDVIGVEVEDDSHAT